MTDNNDLEIIDRVLSGDVDAFSEIISRYNDKVFRYVYSRVNSYEEALDVTQEVFVMTFEALGSFRREAKFYTWLFSIVVNYCKNYRKKMSRYRYVALSKENASGDYEIQLKDDRQNTEEEIINKDSLRIIKEELYQLPEDYREILVLRDIEGMSYNEISKILGIRLSNVKVRIHRGREMLKKRLEDRGLL